MKNNLPLNVYIFGEQFANKIRVFTYLFIYLYVYMVFNVFTNVSAAWKK